MPNFLFMDNKTGAGGVVCAAFQYVNSSPTQIGDTFGQEIGGLVNGCDRNAIIQFQGELYALAKDGVYKKDDPTVLAGPWTIQVTFAFGVSGLATGLYPVEIAGVAYLVAAFRTTDSSNTWRWAKFDGTTWTQPASSVFLGFGNLLIDSLVYRGVLHIVCASTTNPSAYTFDPGTESFAVIADPFANSMMDQGLCIFDDRLFCFFRNAFGDMKIAEFVGGTWSEVLTLVSGNLTANVDEGKSALFTDGVNMYVIGLWNAPAVGFRAYQIDSALAVTEITNAILPNSFKSTSDPGGSFVAGLAQGIEYRWLPVYDADTAPASAAIYIFQAIDAVLGTSFTMWQWNGPAALLTSVDSGGDVGHAVPSNLPQGGCRIFTPGELDVKIASRQGVLGGEEITFRAYGGGTGRKFKMFYSIGGDPDLIEATLIAPVTGGSATFNVGLNQVEGIAADGATDYTIIWDIGTDGVTAGTILDRFPQITV